MKRYSWPLIKKRINPSGHVSYMVDPGMVNGKRPRRFFHSKTDAETYADQLRIAKKNEGNSAFSVSEKLRLHALDAERQLDALGSSFSEAVAFYLKHAAPRGGNKKLLDVIRELVDSKRKSGKRGTYLRPLEWVLNSFARNFDGKEINEVTRVEIESWLDAKFDNLTTRRNRIRDVSILFSFAKKHGYCGSNPFDEIERPTVPTKRPEIFAPTAATLKDSGQRLGVHQQRQQLPSELHRRHRQ